MLSMSRLSGCRRLLVRSGGFVDGNMARLIYLPINIGPDSTDIGLRFYSSSVLRRVADNVAEGPSANSKESSTAAVSRQEMLSRLADTRKSLVESETKLFIKSLLSAGVDCRNGGTDDRKLCTTLLLSLLKTPTERQGATLLEHSLEMLGRSRLSLSGNSLTEAECSALSAKLEKISSAGRFVQATKIAKMLQVPLGPSLNAVIVRGLTRQPLPQKGDAAGTLLHNLRLLGFTHHGGSGSDTAVGSRLQELLCSALTCAEPVASALADFTELLPRQTFAELSPATRTTLLEYIEGYFEHYEEERQAYQLQALAKLRMEFNTLSPALHRAILLCFAKPVKNANANTNLLLALMRLRVAYPGLGGTFRKGFDTRLMAAFESSISNQRWANLSTLLTALTQSGFHAADTTAEVREALYAAVGRQPSINPHLIAGLSNTTVYYKNLPPETQKHFTACLAANSDWSLNDLRMLLRHLGQMGVPWSQLPTDRLEAGIQQHGGACAEGGVSLLLHALQRMEVGWDALQPATRLALCSALLGEVGSMTVEKMGKLLLSLAVLTHDSAEMNEKGSQAFRMHAVVCECLVRGAQFRNFKLAKSIGTYAALLHCFPVHREAAAAVLAAHLDEAPTTFDMKQLQEGTRMREGAAVVVAKPRLLPYATLPLANYAVFRIERGEQDSITRAELACFVLSKETEEPVNDDRIRHGRMCKAILAHYHPEVGTVRTLEEAQQRYFGSDRS